MLLTFPRDHGSTLEDMLEQEPSFVGGDWCRSCRTQTFTYTPLLRASCTPNPPCAGGCPWNLSGNLLVNGFAKVREIADSGESCADLGIPVTRVFAWTCMIASVACGDARSAALREVGGSWRAADPQRRCTAKDQASVGRTIDLEGGIAICKGNCKVLFVLAALPNVARRFFSDSGFAGGCLANWLEILPPYGLAID